MDLRPISQPTRQQKLAVVAVADVKAQARISGSDEDGLIEQDIITAYDYLSGPEGWLNGCCLLEEEWEFYPGPALPARLELPLRPFRSLTSVEMRGSGSYAALTPAPFLGIGYGRVGTLVRRAPDVAALSASDPERYRIRFKAGFGTTKDSIPSPIRKGMLMLCSYWHAQRETVGAEGRAIGQEVQYGLKALCGRYRISPDHS